MNINDFKNYDFADYFEIYSEYLHVELLECEDEGRDLSAIRDRIEKVIAMEKGPEKENLADGLWYEMMACPIRADYPYVEPDGYEEILKARPADRKKYAKPEKNDALYDRIYGAWRGRVCGCLLGKGVEGMMRGDIERLLKAEGNFPLTGYIGRDQAIVESVVPDDKFWEPKSRVRRIVSCYNPGAMPPDDDTNYTVLAAMKIIGNHGRNFTPTDVSREWLQSQPGTAYRTAEHVAAINMMNGIAPPASASYKSPAREWIGAEIRADYFGYISPGDPEEAARMAYNDACISQVKNGIYGEMFMAAAIAAAAVTDDPLEVLYAGLGEIPEKSRLAEGVHTVIGWYKEGVALEDALERIHGIWDESIKHHWCHTISNVMIVAACLLLGGLDYGRTICAAVQTGFDTDCNAATVGSIIGMMKGKDAIGPEWVCQMNDTVETTIIGCGTYTIAELTDITMSHVN